MEAGFNTDLSVAGVSLHVQTEDWGFANPWIVTRVYQKGILIDSIKTPYSEVLRNRNAFLLLRNKDAMAKALREAMREQHDKIVRALEDRSVHPS